MRLPPLTGQQLAMLYHLRGRKRGLSSPEIGRRLGVSPPQISRLARALLELGLIERQLDPDDARRHRLVATRKGDGVSLQAKDFASLNGRRRA